MKRNSKILVAVGAFASFLFVGCETHHHARYDNDHYRHHDRWNSEYRRDVGRPPGYYEGSGVDVHIGSEPVRRDRW